MFTLSTPYVNSSLDIDQYSNDFFRRLIYHTYTYKSLILQFKVFSDKDKFVNEKICHPPKDLNSNIVSHEIDLFKSILESIEEHDYDGSVLNKKQIILLEDSLIRGDNFTFVFSVLFLIHSKENELRSILSNLVDEEPMNRMFVILGKVFDPHKANIFTNISNDNVCLKTKLVIRDIVLAYELEEENYLYNEALK